MLQSRCLLLLFLAAVSLCHAETRRALLVGINEYLPEDPAVKEWKPTALRPIPVFGKPSRPTLPSLRGAENDAQQMADVLEQRFGFKHENIKILRSSEATADRILTTLKSFLIEPAAKDDVSLFFYAGHGSRMRNTKSDEDSKMDSTILPADAMRGVPDIRGKELARIYRLAVEKHVTLTVIQDSCYSGSGARGALYTDVIERAAEPDDNRYVEDAFTDEHGAPMKFPEDEGVLVLSAAQDYQPAAELARTDLNGPHGVFTWALLKVLWTVSESEPVEYIYQRTRALMQTRVPSQEPVLAGKGRESKSLLGQPASSLRSRLVPVARFKDGVITLGGGFAMGLRDGTELKRYSPKDTPVEIKITKVTGINSAEAKIAEAGGGAKVNAGDLFQVDRWVVPDDDTLRIYFPRPAPPLAEIESVAQALRPLRISAAVRWLDDPTVTPPDYVLSWNGKEWALAPPGGKPISLGARPNAMAVAKAMNNRGSLFVLLPPARELLESIVLGAGTANDAVRITGADEQPDYVLLGRATKGGPGLEYAWAVPHLTERDLAREVTEAHARKLPPPKNAMPLRSSWVEVSQAGIADAGASLTDLALRLARIRGWIQLAPPTEAAEYPYHLALQNAVTNEIKTEGETFGGDVYRLVLQADRKKLDAMQAEGGVPQRWVYVFVIDSKGRGQLIYPPPGRGAVGNRLPVLADGQTTAPAVISLTGRGGEFQVTPPFGVDTFYMLASDERVPEPSVLTFDGVNVGERGMGGATPLGRLLVGVGAGSRGVTAYTGGVPVDWGIERHLFVSQAK